jgi:hypothetical protein
MTQYANIKVPVDRAFEAAAILKRAGIPGHLQLNIDLIEPTKVAAVTDATPPPPLTQLPAGFESLRAEGLTGEMIIMERVMIEPRLYHTSEFRRAFRSSGWNGASYSSALSKLVKDGKVNRVRPRYYAKTGVLVQMANAAKERASNAGM